MDDYIIPFKGLADDSHLFHYELDESFFEALDYSELHHGKVLVDLEFNKQERMIELHFTLHGAVEVECDRCLEPFMMPIAGERDLFLKYGDAYREEDDNILIIPRDAHQFDVRPFLYEFILLMLPYKRVHPEDDSGNSGCDPAMIQLLNRHKPLSGADARWVALRDIQDKLDN